MITTEELYTLYKKHPEICTDTRKARPGSIFFALRGEQFDGNAFAEKALEAGCAYAVVDDPALEKKERFIFVDDSLEVLQALAFFHRKKFQIPFIAITGTNGKTTTKELIYTVLASSFRTQATQGNLNNHIGVPLTILGIKPDTEMAIIEMGANHPGEIEALCNIARPTHGIITNIGKAHLEGFGGYEGVIKTKKELYNFIENKGGFIFLNSDDKLLTEISESIYFRIFYGQQRSSQCHVIPLTADPFAAVKWNFLKSELTIQTSLVGSYNYPNIAAAICVGDYFGIQPDIIKSSLEAYIPKNNRSEIQKTERNTLIMDAYNANPSSMNAALDSFSTSQFKNKIAILGDMLELGSESEKEHQQILEKAIELNFGKLYLVGPVFSSISKSGTSFQNASEALDYFTKNKISESTILLKGSRGIGLEKIVEAL
ncbi:MAG: UDP-N-acetylmuramoyl-tripeptide--D-alanyl-D-alanine ligase [Bacteroidota bacterium]